MVWSCELVKVKSGEGSGQLAVRGRGVGARRRWGRARGPANFACLGLQHSWAWMLLRVPGPLPCAVSSGVCALGMLGGGALQSQFNSFQVLTMRNAVGWMQAAAREGWGQGRGMRGQRCRWGVRACLEGGGRVLLIQGRKSRWGVRDRCREGGWEVRGKKGPWGENTHTRVRRECTRAGGRSVVGGCPSSQAAGRLGLLLRLERWAGGGGRLFMPSWGQRPSWPWALPWAWRRRASWPGLPSWRRRAAAGDRRGRGFVGLIVCAAAWSCVSLGCGRGHNPWQREQAGP